MTRFAKTIPVLAAALAVAVPAQANTYQTETRDGVRHIVPIDENRITPEVALMQRRAIEMGLFQWPAPKGKVEIDQVSRPKQVADCPGHDPAYVPAHELASEPDWKKANVGIARASIYEWFAYRNAIVAGDCSCASLHADWDEAVSTFDAMREGVDNFKIYTHSPVSMRTTIKRDFDGMCDVRMLLELD